MMMQTFVMTLTPNSLFIDGFMKGELQVSIRGTMSDGRLKSTILQAMPSEQVLPDWNAQRIYFN